MVSGAGNGSTSTLPPGHIRAAGVVKNAGTARASTAGSRAGVSGRSAASTTVVAIARFRSDVSANASPAPTSPAVNSDSLLGMTCSKPGSPARRFQGRAMPVARPSTRSCSPIANTATTAAATSGTRARRPPNASAPVATTSSGHPRNPPCSSGPPGNASVRETAAGVAICCCAVGTT